MKFKLIISFHAKIRHIRTLMWCDLPKTRISKIVEINFFVPVIYSSFITHEILGNGSTWPLVENIFTLSLIKLVYIYNHSQFHRTFLVELGFIMAALSCCSKFLCIILSIFTKLLIKLERWSVSMPCSKYDFKNIFIEPSTALLYTCFLYSFFYLWALCASNPSRLNWSGAIFRLIGTKKDSTSWTVAGNWIGTFLRFKKCTL